MHNGACLFVLLFFLSFSFFLGAKLGFFLLFLFAFIFTSPVTHVSFSAIEDEWIENECFSQRR